ncbi:hypothetical protein AB1Y20_006018 [Prymnesium parvum]|uniref:Insulin-degrading enzyme n=1 Tax=Prymnesium parvum TaxID=97485 RepID=A0AB34J1H0_PRYPA
MEGAAKAMEGFLAVETSEGFWKPDLDPRAYRWLRLENKLEVVLISDPNADKAAAAMDVNVGHASDPEALPGLAHFLEHMLFLGTEKYPDEGYYQAYLQERGGSSNAYTDFEHTNFFFDFHPVAPQALDIFAQFFLCPLFTESMTARELNAVDSENSKNLQNDAWRLQQLYRWAASSEHPFHKFGTGNLATLTDVPASFVAAKLSVAPDGSVSLAVRPRLTPAYTLRDALFAFHKEHYSANTMKLAVLGREPLDTLQRWAEARFSAVPNRDRPPLCWPAEPYPHSRLRRRFEVVPVREMRSLTVAWPLPSLRPLYRTKPHRYISHLLGHESAGSLLSLLKSKGWVDTLCAGEFHDSSDFALFEVQVELTELGEAAVDEIMPYVFEYIQMLRSQPPSKWIHDEVAGLSEMGFRFKDLDDPISAVSVISSDMQHYPPAELLSFRYLFAEFNPQPIVEMLSLLTPERASTVFVSKATEPRATLTEPWYGTKFHVEPIAQSTLDKWSAIKHSPSSPLSLPAPNPFVPTDFSLVCDRLPPVGKDEVVLPRLVLKTPFCKLWHKTDSTFRRPKSNLYMDVVAPIAYERPSNVCLTRIFTKLLEDELTEYAYDAACASLDYSVYNCSTGLRVMLSGYSHKMPVLLEKVIGKMVNAQLDEERFHAIKDVVHREYCNFFKEQPYQHAMYMASQLLEESRWHILEYLSFSMRDECNYAAVCDFARTQLLKQVHLKVLLHGNADADQARAFVETAQRTLGSAELHQLPSLRLLQLREGEEVILRQHPSLLEELQAKHSNDQEVNSATEVYLQVGVDERPNSVLVEMAAQVISKPCYHQLRTIEQLGYIVFSGPRSDLGVLGLRLLVQSSTYDAAHLDHRMEGFLSTVPAMLNEMSDEEFTNHRQALLDLKLEKPKKLRQESSRYWSEIPYETLDFARDVNDARVLQNLEKEQLIEFWMKYFDAASPRRRKLSSQVFAASRALPPRPTGSNIICLDGRAAAAAFKKTLVAFPAPMPVTSVEVN